MWVEWVTNASLMCKLHAWATVFKTSYIWWTCRNNVFYYICSLQVLHKEKRKTYSDAVLLSHDNYRLEEPLFFIHPEEKDMGCGQSTNPKCYLELAINGNVIGRLIIEVRADKVPKTAENFRALCTGENGNSYAGTSIHRIVPGFIAQVKVKLLFCRQSICFSL